MSTHTSRNNTHTHSYLVRHDMDPRIPTKKSHNDNIQKRQHKSRSIPNGFVEDWSAFSDSMPLHSKTMTDKTHAVQNTVPTCVKQCEKQCDKQDVDRYDPSHESNNLKSTQVLATFNAVSIILSTQTNLLLNADNSYDVKFSTGMTEGNGISINDQGNIVTFSDDGSYRFEICGEGALFSDVDVKLVYFSELFPDDIKPFSETTIPKDDGKLQLRGIPTILPMQKGQSIITRLIPVPDESIVLLAGTRLLIHRVA